MLDFPELPPIATAPISAVLLAWNAESFLEKTVADWMTYLEGRRRPYELFLVDAGSTDQTGKLGTALTGRNPRLRLLRHDTPCGLGACLRTALQAAQYPLLFYTLCSEQYRSGDLALLLKWIDKADLVSGYRPGPRRFHGWSFGDAAYRWLAWLLFGVRLSDLDCLFLLARRSIFRRIPVQSDGRFAHVEILAKANFLGCLMTEVPIHAPRSGAGPHPGETWLQTLTEAYRVFSHPDFGPPLLPDEARAAKR